MGQSAPWPTNEIERLVGVRSIYPLHDAPNEELSALSHLAKDMFATARAGIHILDEDWMHIAYQSGQQLNSCAREISVCNSVVLNNDVFVIPDMTQDPDWESMPYVSGGPKIRFYAGAPIELDTGIVIGAFCLTDSEPKNFSEQEKENLKRFAKLAAALFRLQKANFTMSLAEIELRSAAMTDPLTGFYNRKALDLLVDEQLRDALRDNDSFGALYLDMDGFKTINDTLGHAAGDQILQDSAVRIRSCIRSQDTVVRMGGDEFVVFVPRPRAPETLERIAERLLDAFRQPFEVHGTEVVANLSIGGAMAPQSGCDRVTLLRNVDEALYQAKKAGRNRFISRAL
ncbi:sensor domain-containing diguanylate cyclase [Agrobacterium larrymoorei]|uniref:sensor domain-containing diguanylate cyclase n=1 Tax=Agrobacterium larrymoorei TaxID=160699 RepID=UPI0015738459|nr:sensor domain-containing diguanylate cyclase [Agrobacterium larrymoorei]NTJ42039.1 sensor domain-containing diguanylate cyclase [Agrobacterium larrymoorei]